MSDNQGWIKVWRSLDDHEEWDAITMALLLHLLLKVEWRTSRDVLYRGKIYTLNRGQIMVSALEIARRLRCSRKEIENRILVLEKAQVLGQEVTRRGKLITILNYSRYQDEQEREKEDEGQEKGQEKGQDRDKRGTRDNLEAYSPKESAASKKGKKDKKEEREEEETGVPVSPLSFAEGVSEGGGEEIEAQYLEPGAGTHPNGNGAEPGRGKPKKPRIPKAADPEDIALASEWLDYAKSEMGWGDHTPPWATVAKYADAIAKARRGGVTLEGLREVLEFVRNDQFWARNALSPGGLLRSSANGARKLDNILVRMAPGKSKLDREAERLMKLVNDDKPFNIFG